MNIITDPTSNERGGKFKQEAGEGGFLKTTFNYNTGLMMGDKLALVVHLFVRLVMVSLTELGQTLGHTT